MKTKITRIEKTKATCISTARCIQMAIGISTEQYHNHLFETGCLFLHHHFPEKEGYQKYFEYCAYDKKFWSFWKLEFKAFNNMLITGYGEELTLSHWIEEINYMAKDDKVYHNFYSNYYKYLNHKI